MNQLITSITIAISALFTPLILLIKLAILLVIGMTATKYFGARAPFVTAANATELAYLAGAFWLITR
jgi:hypothetical protein